MRNAYRFYFGAANLCLVLTAMYGHTDIMLMIRMTIRNSGFQI